MENLMYILLLIFFVGIALYFIYLHGELMKLDSNCNQAWENINIQLERRYNLLKVMVELADVRTEGKKQMLEKIMDTRKAAMEITTPYEKGKVEKLILNQIKLIFSLANEFPQLRQDREFAAMRNIAVEIEEYLQEARRSYNASVTRWNQKKESFPTKLLAKLFRLKTKEFFQPNEPYEKLPEIKLQ